ncbi:MAG: fibronectin type III domain-containing protein [Kofleriaceae bacterium]
MQPSGHVTTGTARREPDVVAPAAPTSPKLVAATSKSATVSFLAPGDDGLVGKVRGYEVRIQSGVDITEATFESASLVAIGDVPIAEPGTEQRVELTGLLFETEYSVAIRAFDDCRNKGPISTLRFATTARTSGEVDACFVATAAYGSLLANDVEMLRHFRDALLRRTVLGELAVQAYYTFGPAVAGAVGESELLRETARAVLDPLVRAVASLRL